MVTGDSESNDVAVLTGGASGFGLTRAQSWHPPTLGGQRLRGAGRVLLLDQ
jgi:hypothetical protein